MLPLPWGGLLENRIRRNEGSDMRIKDERSRGRILILGNGGLGRTNIFTLRWHYIEVGRVIDFFIRRRSQSWGLGLSVEGRTLTKLVKSCEDKEEKSCTLYDGNSTPFHSGLKDDARSMRSPRFARNEVMSLGTGTRLFRMDIT